MKNKDWYSKALLNKKTKETDDQILIAAIDALDPRYSPNLTDEEFSALQHDIDIDVAQVSHMIIRGFVIYNTNVNR